MAVPEADRSGGVDPEALWLERAQPRRGRPPAHTRAEVTAAAVAIADADGLAAVTMRGVAARVGVGVMSLYSYVPNKETLLELMIDRVAGDQPTPPAPTGAWTADLRAMAHAQRDLMLRHPWLPAALQEQQTLGPNTLAFTEHALAVLEPAGFDGQGALEVFSLVTGFVASHVGYEVARDRAAVRAGRTTGELAEAQGRYLRAVAASPDHPRLARILAEPARSADPDATFDRLLGHLLDGLAATRAAREG
ncbi:TetR/AcrR family transcriptional regulator C-terminal domain-containing protein [Embleya sp. MST-111070]|uniref:TetR/AcrR family transcriptional regulator C-terminal domain-containing protein n=1 Tax=Embleya sp. MST-111070 TaxID=3398231 RepID=UPI003F731B51